MENNLTDNEIIQALELCATLDSSNCTQCPCRESCNENDGTLTKAVLDLINRLKAQIEGLQDEVVIKTDMLNHQKAEIERLHKLQKPTTQPRRAVLKNA